MCYTFTRSIVCVCVCRRTKTNCIWTRYSQRHTTLLHSELSVDWLQSAILRSDIISHSTRILQQYCNLHWRMTFAADEWMGITFLPQCALDKRRKLDYLYTTRFARTIRDDMPTLWWPCMPSRFQFCSVFLLYMFGFFFFFLLIVNNWNWILIRQPLINQSINEVSVIHNTGKLPIALSYVRCWMIELIYWLNMNIFQLCTKLQSIMGPDEEPQLALIFVSQQNIVVLCVWPSCVTVNPGN